MQFRQFVIVFTSVFLWVGCSGHSQHSASSPISTQETRVNAQRYIDSPYVILVSIDGYRPDYTDLYKPTNLEKFRKSGSSAKGLIPVFPSKTFPNHYSIVTGLYPENHGIVANTFYDLSRPGDDQLYKLSNRAAVTDGTWYSGFPVWVVAEQAGMLSANYFWPGGEARIQNYKSTYFVPYDQKIPNRERVEQVIKWLQLPAEKRPHFITLYFSDVDSAGHSWGPNSNEVKDAVLNVDESIGLLQEGISKLSLPINLVVVSDHGMAEMDPAKIEYLDEYVSFKDITVGDLGPLVSIYRKEGEAVKLAIVYEALKKNAKHYKIYRRADLPKDLHFSRTHRVGDFVVIAEPGYSVGLHDERFKYVKGNHGYDPRIMKEMRGIFYAKGPNIRSGMRLRPFTNIHIYPFLLKILGLEKEARETIDGSGSVLRPLFKK